MDFLPKKNWIKSSDRLKGLEAIDVYFSDYVYDRHSHDTFAIGITLSGIQQFQYSGIVQHNLPGSTMVLYPDEKHDGCAGSETGLHYQMIYIQPALIQEIIQTKPLPFVKNGISMNSELFKATNYLLNHIDSHDDPIGQEDALYDLITKLDYVAGHQSTPAKAIHYQAVKRVREYIHASLHDNITLEDIEKHTGFDRWAISRHFRLFFGTSPYRYMIMRRLDLVKSKLLIGASLADAAIEAGFFDQSHMSKHFKKAFGLSPLRWISIVLKS